MQALEFVARTLLELYIITFLLRFLLQWARADFHNPLSQFIVQVTNPLVRPVRRVVPGIRGFDLSTFLIAYVLQLLTTTLSITLMTRSIPANIPLLLVMSFIDLLLLQLRVFIYLIIGSVLLSWFAPYHPVAVVLRSLTAPLLRPFQRLLPPIANLDLSPMFAMIALVALTILVQSNEHLIRGLVAG